MAYPEVLWSLIDGLGIRQMHFKARGDFMQGHTHEYHHITLLARGRLQVRVDDKVTEYIAPHMIFIHKNLQHHLTALEDDTLAYCILRTQMVTQGNNVENPFFNFSDEDLLKFAPDEAMVDNLAIPGGLDTVLGIPEFKEKFKET